MPSKHKSQHVRQDASSQRPSVPLDKSQAQIDNTQKRASQNENDKRESDDYAFKKTQLKQNWVSIGVAGVTGFAVIVYMIISLFQLWEIKKQSDYSRQALEQTARRFTVTERPRIFAEGTSFYYFRDAKGIERAGVSVVFRNTGHSPAFNVRIRDCIQVRENEPDGSDESSAKCLPRSLGVIGPNTTFTLNSITQEVVPKDSLQETYFEAGRHVYYWGKITYEVFSEPVGWTNFRYVNAGKQLAPSSTGNDADTYGQEKPN